ncbi:MAG: phosphatidylserine decarboxylase [bacterium]|nr:phosphatidylserine decarboxylase [bacterium]
MTEENRRRLPIAREGWRYVAGLLIAAFLAGFLWSGIAAGTLVVLACAVAAFFRNPERTPPADPTAVVAPADGRVVAVAPGACGGEVIRIFLSPLDVHINRSPVAGEIRGIQYQKGRFVAAFREDASEVNERNSLDIQTDAGENFRVVQIAGVLARRIVCWSRVGDRLPMGERFGLIQFGSRTDLHLPEGFTACCRVGDRVRGGETIIARKNQG